MTVFDSNPEDGEQTVAVQTGEELSALTEELTRSENPPETHVIADESALLDINNVFSVEGPLQSLIDAGTVTLSSAPNVENTLLYTENMAASLINTSSGYLSVQTEADADVNAVESVVSSLQEDSDEVDLETASLDCLIESLSETFGSDMSDHFQNVFQEHDFSETTHVAEVLLVLAAYNQELLSDISNLGERTGAASKATFSRSKSTLEDAGVIHTEKVTTEVGRPPLRLTLGDEVEPGSPSEAVGLAYEKLA